MNLVPTELFSTEAREAEKRFGIEPRRVFAEEQGKQTQSEVFLGVAFTSGVEEVVIPFFDRGLPVEYELTRSIRVVSKSDRKKLGILTTDAKLTGGMDMRTFSQTPEWSIVTELKKQYDVSSVSPDTPISSDLNVLLVAQPSSLSQKQIDNLTDYIKKGGAALLLLDPFPVDNPSMSPELPKMPPGGPFGGGPPPEPKGNLRPLLDLVGLDWPSTEIVWNVYNPHPQARPAIDPRDRLYRQGERSPRRIQRRSKGQRRAFRRSSRCSPAYLRPEDGGGHRLRPALAHRCHRRHGCLERLCSAEFHGLRRRQPAPPPYSHRQKLYAGRPADRPGSGRLQGRQIQRRRQEKRRQVAPAAKINVIAIADLDLIGEQFFKIRQQKVEDLDFDNVPFVLNCVDILAGDESFVGLRKKRPLHRRFDVIETAGEGV